MTFGAQKLRIGLTNDDGIHAEGLLSLARELISRGHTIRISAPAKNQSAMSHSLSIYRPVRVEKIQLPGELFRGVVSFCVHGTPADSAKIFSSEISRDWKPDIVVSGVNCGYNVGHPVVSSGTVSAAREANYCGFPAIAFSTNHSATDRQYAEVAQIAVDLVEKALVQQLPKLSIINVNLPVIERAQFKGFRLTRQGNACYVEEFRIKKNVNENIENQMDLQKHPQEDPVSESWWFVLEGHLVEGEDESIDTDYGAVKAGYGSVTPMGTFFHNEEQASLVQSARTAFNGLLLN